MRGSTPRRPAHRRVTTRLRVLYVVFFATLTPATILLPILATPVLTGCGDPHTTPLLAGSTAPRIRTRLGEPRVRGALEIPPQKWTMTGEAGKRFQRESRRSLRAQLGLGSKGIALSGHDTGSTRIRIDTTQGFTLDDATYEDVLYIHREKDRLVFVGETDLETYVAGVVPNEMGPDAPAGAYRAQAIAARTYAYERLRRPGAPTRQFHVYDSQRSQVYRGRSPLYQARYPDGLAAARATRGVVLMMGARVFPAYYSSTCGGHTTDYKTASLDPKGGETALAGVPCKWCTHSKYYRWKPPLEVSNARLFAAFKRDGRPLSRPIHAIAVQERGAGGWARTIRITYGPNRRTRDLPGIQFRSLAGARSHRISEIQRTTDGFRLTGGGWGHGCGMCQMGARGMADQGATEQDILRYYYPGISLYSVY